VQRLGYVPDDVTVTWELKEEEQNPMQGYINTCEYSACGKEFYAKTRRKKYCCDKHKLAAHYERKKANEG